MRSITLPLPLVMGNLACLSPQVIERRRRFPVALVSMPFVSTESPSLQLGTLGPLAQSHGFGVETMHLYLDFAACLGLPLLEQISKLTWPTGDWLFSLEAFRQEAPDPQNLFLKEFDIALNTFTVNGLNELTNTLLAVRKEVVPAFLAEVLDRIRWEQFRVVAFTSTFQQNVASFALARRLKERFPDLITIFGGANFEGTMGREWVRSMTMVDYAVTGEGDVAFPALLGALADGVDPLEIPGVLTRRGSEVIGTPPDRPFDRMDELPIPDYGEYFERAERLGLLTTGARRQVQVPFEGARGCWWGAKHHCTFCGLNGQTMAFRTKSPKRLIEELGELVRRYKSFELNAVDNIAAPSILRDVLPQLAHSGATYRLFYELKANLTREQVRSLRDGGVHHVQPGIESLSSAVLALMRKGTRAVTNVNLLRWCRYYGIRVYWNLLWGFPQETKGHYDEQVALIPNLAHLEPPGGASRIWMERFSPLFADSKSFPARSMHPEASLRYVYPEDVNLHETAYFFDFELEHTLPGEAYNELVAVTEQWRRAWQEPIRPSLEWWHAPGLLQIEDRRRSTDSGTHTFEEPLASLYLACSDKPRTAEALRTELSLAYSREEIAEALEEFCQRGLMMRDDNLFLALALPATGGYYLGHADRLSSVKGYPAEDKKVAYDLQR